MSSRVTGPDFYSVVIERANTDGVRVSTSATPTLVPESDVHVTVFEEGIGDSGEITLVAPQHSAQLTVTSEDGTVCLRTRVRHDEPIRRTLPVGTYPYRAFHRSQGPATMQRGEFTVGATPVEIEIVFSD